MNEKDRDTHPDERFQRIEALFHAVADLGPEAASNYLDRHARDPAERAEVEQLLAADASGIAEAALSSLVPAAIEAEQAAERDALIGSRIGPWKLTGSYGVGGMGVVYRAERDDGAFRQLAAVKLVRGLAVSELQVARFVAERQILARLEHPGIARLLDGGSHDGVPWLAMEAVDGQPIDLWCQGRPMAERLTLFIKVCEAVQYAHSNLIIHRDLKPSNVLVDSTNQPKLLDFGIAKLIQADDTIDERTRTQFRMLTPEFASPEQLLGEPVTTASDVYSLGVLLFRLLTGQSPYATTEDGKRNPAALAASDDTITRPSAAVLRGETDSTRGAAGRQLARSLRGDLDAIVMKALRRDAGKRYASAAALGDDLRRHLDLLPVLARKESARYQMARFARRHWQGMIAAAAGLALATATVALYTARLDEQRQAAESAREAAEQARRSAGLVTDFLLSTIAQTDVFNRSAKRTLEDVLEDATTKIETQLQQDPSTRAAVLQMLGRVWDSYRSADDKAEHLLREALTLFEARDGIGSESSVDTRYRMIPVLQRLGRGDEALALGDEVLPAAQARLGDRSVTLAKLLVVLSSGLRSSGAAMVDRSLEYLQWAQRIMENAQPPPPSKDLRSMYVGLVLEQTTRGHYQSALQYAKRLDAVPEPSDFVRSRGVMAKAVAAWLLGDVALAATSIDTAIRLSVTTHPANSPGGHFPQYLKAMIGLLGGDLVPMRNFASQLDRDPLALTDGQKLTRQVMQTALVNEMLLDAGQPSKAFLRLEPWLAVLDDARVKGVDTSDLQRATIVAGITAGRIPEAEAMCARQRDAIGTEPGTADMRRHLELLCAPIFKAKGDLAGYREQARRLAIPADHAELGASADRIRALLLTADADKDRNAAEMALALCDRLAIRNRLRVEALRSAADLAPPGDARATARRAEADHLVAALQPLAATMPPPSTVPARAGR